MSREWGNQSYVFETLDSLISSASPQDLARLIILVFVADKNESWNNDTANTIYRNYTNLCETGVIQIIGVPPEFYPDFTKMKPTLNDSVFRTAWRSKQNLDLVFMMQYVYIENLSPYYLQNDDDVITYTGYIRDIDSIIDMHKEYWVCIELSNLGFIGKLFPTHLLQKFSNFYLNHYSNQPNDLMLHETLRYLGQSRPIRTRYSVFQHAGKVSSLKNKIMPWIDSKFKALGKTELTVSKVPIGDNPSAIIVTNMIQADIRHFKDFAYTSRTSYFRAVPPKAGSFYRIIYSGGLNIRRIAVSTGDDKTRNERLLYGEVSVGQFNINLRTLLKSWQRLAHSLTANSTPKYRGTKYRLWLTALKLNLQKININIV